MQMASRGRAAGVASTRTGSKGGKIGRPAHPVTQEANQMAASAKRVMAYAAQYATQQSSALRGAQYASAYLKGAIGASRADYARLQATANTAGSKAAVASLGRQLTLMQNLQQTYQQNGSTRSRSVGNKISAATASVAQKFGQQFMQSASRGGQSNLTQQQQIAALQQAANTARSRGNTGGGRVASAVAALRTANGGSNRAPTGQAAINALLNQANKAQAGS